MGLAQLNADELQDLRDEEQHLIDELTHNDKEIRLLRIERTELEDRLERVRRAIANVQ